MNFKHSNLIKVFLLGLFINSAAHAGFAFSTTLQINTEDSTRTCLDLKSTGGLEPAEISFSSAPTTWAAIDKRNVVMNMNEPASELDSSLILSEKSVLDVEIPEGLFQIFWSETKDADNQTPVAGSLHGNLSISGKSLEMARGWLLHMSKTDPAPYLEQDFLDYPFCITEMEIKLYDNLGGTKRTAKISVFFWNEHGIKRLRYLEFMTKIN